MYFSHLVARLCIYSEVYWWVFLPRFEALPVPLLSAVVSKRSKRDKIASVFLLFKN